MFGNRLGWCLSGLIVVLIALGIWYIDSLNRPVAPTALGENAASLKIELAVDPRSVATFMNEERDATEQYRSALSQFQANRELYKNFANTFVKYRKTDKNPSPPPPPAMPAVDLLLKARTARNATMFTSTPGDVIRYEYSGGDPMDDLETSPKAPGLGRVLFCMADICNSKGDSAGARQHYEAIFALGVCLFNERLGRTEYMLGMDCLSYGPVIARYESDQSRVEAWKKFEVARAQLGKASIPDKAYSMLSNPPIDNRLAWMKIAINNSHTGDMIAIAKKGGDRMWRIEAILALGRCKMGDEVPANQKGAVKVINELANNRSIDPAERFAAEKARDVKSASEISVKVYN